MRGTADRRAARGGAVTAPGANASNPAGAAFFDVDNTLMQGASLFHFARGLASRNFFTGRELAAFAAQQVAFRVRGVESLAHSEGARGAALAFVAGRRVADVVRLGEEIYDDRMADRIYPGTRRLAEAHLAANQRVYLVTATPVELARIIAGRLGLTGALGTVAEVVGGRFTGRLTGGLMHGRTKAVAIRVLAAREGIDLAASSAYSDSINDLPMLEAVGRAVAINPDPALRRLAARRGWPIHDFRPVRRAARRSLPGVAAAGVIGGAWAVARRRGARSGR